MIPTNHGVSWGYTPVQYKVMEKVLIPTRQGSTEAVATTIKLNPDYPRKCTVKHQFKKVRNT